MARHRPWRVAQRVRPKKVAVPAVVAAPPPEPPPPPAPAAAAAPVIVEGVLYTEGFLADSDAMFAWAVANVPWDDRIAARKTASFGLPYNYKGLEYEPADFPPELERVRAAASRHVGIEANNCLLNYYPDGHSRMGFHADRVVGLVGGVAIVSLGAQRTLKFRRADNYDVRVDFVLAPGSLLYLPPEVHLEWQHAVPRNSRREGRVSLTFRQLEVE